MTATLIRGAEIAARIREELAAETARLKERGVTPGLATILVGDDPASQSYVRAKNATAHKLGIHSDQHNLPAGTTEAELLALIAACNANPAIHGILVQLPLPRHIDESRVLAAIEPDKDVDGFHPVNVGKMLLGEPCFLPCTPAGIVELLVRSGVEVINPVDQPFDALEAQAVGTVPDAEAFDETVRDVYQKGYRMGKKVLRPAMVTITSGGPARPKPEDDGTEE